MALAGNDDNIILLRQLNSPEDCLPAVNNRLMRLGADFFLHTGLHHAENPLWVLAAWIVRGCHHIVRQLRRNPAHDRPLGVVPVTAAAKDRNNPLFGNLPCRVQDIFQAVRGMGIINYHGKVLTAPHQLKSSRHRGKFLHACLDNRSRHSLCHGSSHSRHYIVHVEDAGNLQFQRQTGLAHPDVKLRAPCQHLDVLRLQHRILMDGVGNMAAVSSCQHVLPGGIINIHHRSLAVLYPRPGYQVKEDGLGLLVVLQGLVVIQMVLGKIGEHGRIKLDACHPVLIQGVAGNLHHHIIHVGVTHHGKGTLQIHHIRRGIVNRQHLILNHNLNGADEPHTAAHAPQHGPEHIADGGLAISAGNAYHPHAASRIIVKIRHDGMQCLL